MTLKVAIIGSGHMARVHAAAWARIPEAKLVGVFDRDQARADAFASGLAGARGFHDRDSLLAGAAPDIVDVCAPTPAHRELAVRAARAGRHVFVEKPMARTLAECDEIAEAVRESGVTLMVGHVLRFFPEYAAARRMIETGAVGAPAAIRTARLTCHPRGAYDDWYADPGQSGGVLLDLAIHDFDWLRACFGEVERVYARGLTGQSSHHGSLDYALATLRLKSGALAHVCGSWAHPDGFRATFEVCGDGGMLEHDSARIAPFSLSLRQAQDDTPAEVAISESPLAPQDDPYCAELRHFTDCVLGGAEPAVTIQDARAAVSIALAALESVRTGRPVAPAQ